MIFNAHYQKFLAPKLAGADLAHFLPELELGLEFYGLKIVDRDSFIRATFSRKTQNVFSESGVAVLPISGAFLASTNGSADSASLQDLRLDALLNARNRFVSLSLGTQNYRELISDVGDAVLARSPLTTFEATSADAFFPNSNVRGTIPSLYFRLRSRAYFDCLRSKELPIAKVEEIFAEVLSWVKATTGDGVRRYTERPWTGTSVLKKFVPTQTGFESLRSLDPLILDQPNANHKR